MTDAILKPSEILELPEPLQLKAALRNFLLPVTDSYINNIEKLAEKGWVSIRPIWNDVGQIFQQYIQGPQQ